MENKNTIELNVVRLGGGNGGSQPTKLSELENDCGFVERNTLGSCAFINKEEILNSKISIQTGGSISEVTIIDQVLSCSDPAVESKFFSDSWTGDEWEAEGGYYEYSSLFYGDSILPITASRWVCKDGKITGYIDGYKTDIIDVPIGNQSYRIRHWFQDAGSTRILVKKTEDSRTYQELTIIEAIKFINEKTL